LKEGTELKKWKLAIPVLLILSFVLTVRGADIVMAQAYSFISDEFKDCLMLNAGYYMRTAIDDYDETGRIWSWSECRPAILEENGKNIISKQFMDFYGKKSVSLTPEGELIIETDNNSDGILGNGTFEGSKNTLKLPDAKIIMAAEGMRHILALDEYGFVWSCGNNAYGQTGVNPSAAKVHTFTKIENLCDITFIAASNGISIAVDSDGGVWSWGSNIYGNFGNGVTGGQNHIPQKAVLPARITEVSAGGGFIAALDTGGGVWTWGLNSGGCLGDNGIINNFYPNKGNISDIAENCVSTPAGVQNISNVKTVSAGKNFVLALKNDGSVWSWGGNKYGQLGDGTFSSKSHPVQVIGISGATNISAARTDTMITESGENDFSAAVAIAGKHVYEWGQKTLFSHNSPKKLKTDFTDVIADAVFTDSNGADTIIIPEDGILNVDLSLYVNRNGYIALYKNGVFYSIDKITKLDSYMVKYSDLSPDDNIKIFIWDDNMRPTVKAFSLEEEGK
jgi:alpha-tubulin suppressor-like RCC1 family protein